MIRTADDGALRILTLDRAEKANAVTAEMLRALAEAAEMASEDMLAGRGARGLVITGAGTVFSAGMDLDAAKAGLATSPLWERVSGAVAAHPGLTIAALNGTLAGGAMGMALACDLRIAVPGAKLFYPVMKMGFLPQPSDPGRLKALVGPSRARLLLMAGAKITVEEAQGWGLIDRIVAPDALMDTARDLAADVAAAEPRHAQAIKAMIG
ncbi:enoyl-CoA hydratase/isomerase family protein [Roseivivax sediminis]|uniref:Enoyl-CoA hydratase/carnithine racemase n=1 Tax=Roseivivax sediminis TaxID=936889 RepID=A0A1I1U761_9RHOB|nr:enoyl-CoA hydratase/isomerase family protein [Roseivivax sediminis]SFD66711.1 Enoyl-CoA hydratase/carnithine racemase [Roseivivax sediminis]